MSPSDSVTMANVAWYQGGTVRREGGVCLFRRAGETQDQRFRCGGLILGLRPGVNDSTLRELLRFVGGVLERDRRDQPSAWVGVTVPEGLELDAIEKALRHSSVRTANMNWSGIVIR